MSDKLLVRRIAVLGAGVMGAQIAAHLTNAGVDTVLFDLAAKEGDPNGIVAKAIANLGKLSPAPLASKSLAEKLTPANYDTGLEAGPVQEDRAIRRRPHRVGQQYLGPGHQQDGRSTAGAAAPPLLRRALFQPPALHAPG